jgi:thymidylate synthase ThyX
MANKERKIFAIEPGKYPEETIAVAFARTSRMPGDIQESLDVLTEEKSAQFHEKWVIGYGHGSVAEHAVLHVGVENISRLATEVVEGSRLASYSEKSTRFQKIGEGEYLIPKSVERSKYLADYEEAHARLFGAYGAALIAVSREMGIDLDNCKPAEKTRVIDVCRYELPMSVLTRLGITANARTMEYLCSKLLSHELEEVREIGTELKLEAVKIAPTLVKYADEMQYVSAVNAVLARKANKILVPRTIEEDRMFSVIPTVEVADAQTHGENEYLAALLFRYAGGYSYKECYSKVKHMSPRQKDRLIADALGKMGEHDKPGRELELPDITFDVLIDEGGFNDLKRNRMLTMVAQEFNGAYGARLPKITEQAGVADKMKEAIRFAEELAGVMKGDLGPDAKYLHTNATLRRMLMKMNIRELAEMYNVRATERANPGYRQPVLQMGELAGEIYPRLWKYLGRKYNYPGSSKIRMEWFGE